MRTEDDDGLIRHELLITAADGTEIAAVMLLPKGETIDAPGIVVVPGHSKPGASGLAQMVLPVDSYQNAAAVKLARAGFATVTMELRGFGIHVLNGQPEHKLVAYNALTSGSFYKKIIVDDLKRVVDAFVQMPEVDADRLGITGVSLGAEIAVEYAALDTRIRAISFHSHGGSVGQYSRLLHPADEQPHYCHFVPGANSLLNREDPFLLLAPRPTQGVRGGLEPFNSEFIEVLREVWDGLGVSERLELLIIRGQGHAYFPDSALDFFNVHLRSASNAQPTARLQ